MEYFPEDVVYQIFSKLPVSSLIRFKSLSKHWNLVLSNRKFIRNHLKNMTCIDNHKDFILQYDLRPPVFYRLRMDSCFNGDEESFRAEVMECPMKTSDKIWNAAAHCDGVLCMFVDNSADYITAVVFNPITKEYKRFPLVRQCGWEAYGFGYDSVIDEYKVIQIKGSLPEKPPKWTSVGSLRLKTGSWNAALDKLPCCFTISSFHKIAQTVNGCLYWIAEKWDENNKWISFVILCFDLESETIREETSLGGNGVLYKEYESIEGFRSIQEPLRNKIISVQRKERMYKGLLGVLGNSLCLARTYEGVSSDLFIMEENEVTKTKYWKKIVRIQRNGPGMYGFKAVDPICVTKNGQVLGSEYRKSKLFLFNQDGLVRKIPIHGLGLPPKGFSVIPYVESLVSPTT